MRTRHFSVEPGLDQPWLWCLDHYREVPRTSLNAFPTLLLRRGSLQQVISEGEATTMSMLGPMTCSALTVIAPVFPLGELVCSLTITLMSSGNEMATFGL